LCFFSTARATAEISPLPLHDALPICRTTTRAFGMSVSPDVRGRDRRVAAVDRVADALADQMVADREDSEAVLGEERAHAIAVVGLGQRSTDIEMVAPACELEAVVPPFTCLRGQRGEWHVGPLAGEERNRSDHAASVGVRSTHVFARLLRSAASTNRTPATPSAAVGRSRFRASASTLEDWPPLAADTAACDSSTSARSA